MSIAPLVTIVSLVPALVLDASSAIAGLSREELEEIYWDCEYMATESTIDLGTAAVCSEIYETLKRMKFAGDFEHFLVWWRQNKEREYSERRDVRLRRYQ